MKSLTKFIALPALAYLFAAICLAQAPPPPPKPAPPGKGVPAGIPAESWREFKHEAGNFAVLMPGNPLEMSQTIEGDIGKIPTHSYIAQRGELVYMTMYADYPISLDTPLMIKTVLDNSRDVFLNSKKGTLVSETDISIDKYSGRELRAMIEGGVIRSKTYIVHQRLYTVLAIARGADKSKRLETKEANEFFGSFRLLSAPEPAKAELEVGKLNLPPDFRTRPISWREVPSPELGFTVWMPCEPFRKKIPLNPNDRRLDISLWIARSERSIYQVAVEPMNASPGDEGQRDILFRSLLNGLLNNSEIKPEGETPLKFEGHPGREYKLRWKLGVGTGRAYLIGNVFYFLIGLPVKNEDDSAEINRFLDSFRLTKDPTATPSLGAASSGGATWREISEPGQGFQVLVPGEPKIETYPTQGALSYSLVSGGDGLLCMVHRERSAADRRAEAKGGTLQKSFILDFVKSSGVEITGENDISVDGRAAHEFKLRKGAATGVARVILSGRDAYSILVLTVLSEVDPKNIARFLESFKLIEKSQKDAFSDSPPPPPPPPAPDRKDAIRVSGGVLQALGTKKVEPEYPPIAKVAGAEGVVNIRVTVSEEGRVVEAEVIDGHPLLRDAALQAARQWEFKPTELPSKPVKVIGVLTFNFTLK